MSSDHTEFTTTPNNGDSQQRPKKASVSAWSFDINPGWQRPGACTKPNLTRVVFGGIAAGVVINALELLFHRVLLDKQWTAAFAALGKKPTGWTTFIPSNFLVGSFAVALYAWLRRVALQLGTQPSSLASPYGWYFG